MNITVQGLTFSYHSTPTLNNVSMQIQEAEVLGMVGPNGSGKSTLLKCINKILEPKQGKILLNQQPITKISRIEIAKTMGYVPQSAINNNENISVFEMVLMGRRPHITWQSSEKDEEKVWKALTTLSIEKLAMRNFYELSGGEQQRVLVARSIAQEAKVLLLDEPTSNLDIRHQLEVMDLTRKIVLTKKLTVVIAIHDLNLAARFCDKVIMMKDGKIFVIGETKSVLTADNISKVYGVEVEINCCKNTVHIIPIAPLN
ncbi:MAG: ABC transporter ATP-binding protein [Nitrososphaerota archaeon]|jgi:iron complex transport system ATP-binding protein|nr:ABC transporter ATP-binding protein [Nitrososphaerota archaeon]